MYAHKIAAKSIHIFFFKIGVELLNARVNQTVLFQRYPIFLWEEGWSCATAFV